MEMFERECSESFPIEQLEATEKIEGVQLTNLQKSVINEAVDFASMDTKEVVDEYDTNVKAFNPQLKTNIHLSLMDGYNAEWREFLNHIEPHYLEAVPDKEQVESIAQYMSGIEEIRFENWGKLSLDQRVEVLNEMESKIAAIEHRPSGKIVAKTLDEGYFGQQLGSEITINTRYLEESASNPGMLKDVLNTLIHEGRHLYQVYNVDVRMVHESPTEVEEWRSNLYKLGYHSGEPTEIRLIGPISYTTEQLVADGQRLYYYQPVEIGARTFAGDVMKAYEAYLEQEQKEDSYFSKSNISFKGVNDKVWNLEKAEEHQDWVNWYEKKAAQALENGDLTKAKDYEQKAKVESKKVENYIWAAEHSTK